MPELNTGDTAWVLISAALVLLMTPGLAFFYGGMVRAKSVLNMMLMSFASIAVVSVLWVLYGYKIAFGDSGSPWIGELGFGGLDVPVTDMIANGAYYPIPVYVFAAFQLMFAIITPALISGAIADRAKFLTWVIFVAIWVSVVYFPVAHWVFDFGDENAEGAGWLAGQGVLDFAGGTAVHINAGAAALALAIVLGKRVGFKRESMRPHSLPLVLLGAALLWFGWFGFNAGSALGANGVAAIALLNTQVATAAALAGWLVVERIRDGHATSLGAASGAIGGLVAITPAAAFVTPTAAIAIGFIAGILTALAVGLKYKFGYDDSLDVVGVHLVGGLWGTLSLGFFATTSLVGFGGDGLLYGGGIELLIKQATGAIAVMIFSFVVTYILGTVLEKTIGFRVSRDEEVEGIDLTQHAESAYELDSRGGGIMSSLTKSGNKEA
jgi:ammonium transporter, Amt family